MKQQDTIKLFEEKQVRTMWDEDIEEWYVSIIDVIQVLAESKDYQTARKYWNKLKQRLKEEGNQTVTNCHQLKMKAPDGKMRLTDVASTEQLFRLIQAIPSPKAEPFKLWLATLAKERLDEMQDDESKNVAKIAKEELEAKTGKKVVTDLNAKKILENKR